MSLSVGERAPAFTLPGTGGRDYSLADFEKIDIRPEVRPLILKWNAARLLGLAPPEPA